MIKQHKGETGSALVEFSLMCILYLIIILGIVDMGRALFAYNFVASSARQATRYALVRGACQQAGEDCLGQVIQTDIENYVGTLAVGMLGFQPQNDVIAYCQVGPNIGGMPCAPGTDVIVEVKYNFQFISPLVPLSWQMKSQSQMVVLN